MMTAALQTTSHGLEDQVVETALTGLSPCTRRAYKGHIQRWRAWAAGMPLDRVAVKGYMRALELAGASAQVRNQALAALKKVAYEASELGWIDPTITAQIRNIKSKPIRGVRMGKWLKPSQAAALLKAPDGNTITGRRDRCVLALLIGCGLRRSEACALTLDQVKILEEGRMILTNLYGKGGRIRSVAVPVWAAEVILAWMEEVRVGQAWRMLKKHVIITEARNYNGTEAAQND